MSELRPAPASAEGDEVGNRAIDVPPAPDEPSLLTLTIELEGSSPRIWRRLTLPGDDASAP